MCALCLAPPCLAASVLPGVTSKTVRLSKLPHRAALRRRYAAARCAGAALSFVLASRISRPSIPSPAMASFSSILPAVIQAAGVVWGCHILASALGKSTEAAADSAGSHGLAKLGAAAQAYKPAWPPWAARGSADCYSRCSQVSAGQSRHPQRLLPPPPPPLAALGCVLACTASSCKAILLPLLRSSMSLTPAPPTLSACSAPRCKDCGERLAEKGANGSRSNTRCVKR